jgi:enoyl-CoA hydratase
MDLEALEYLRFTREGPIGRLALHRPDKLNSFTGAMWDEMARVGEVLKADEEIRCLVVSGDGRAFSSGIDTSVFGGGVFDDIGGDAGSRHDDRVVDAIMRTQDAFTWFSEAPFATIAAVHGYALGAGLQCALACDIRVFARGTQVGLLELQYGMLPDLGGTQRLPRLVGEGKAKELIFTGAKIDADEAYRIGLCERLVAADALSGEVDALAALVAAKPPLAIRGVKTAIEAAGHLSERDGLRVEAERQAVCLTSDDLKEALTAFVEGRAPDYHAR